MRRKLGAITALVCLFAAGAAYAAGPVTGGPNTYTGNFVGHRWRRDGGQAAARAGWTETLGMGSTTSGNVGAPLVSIKTTTYGAQGSEREVLPDLHRRQDQHQGASRGKWNARLPEGLPGRDRQRDRGADQPDGESRRSGRHCQLGLWVYNAGPGKLTYFFTTSPAQCDGLATGAAAAWTGTVSQAGKYSGHEHAGAGRRLLQRRQRRPVRLARDRDAELQEAHRQACRQGATRIIESIGCSKSARPFTIAYTATDSNSGSPTVGTGTVKGSAKC